MNLFEQQHLFHSGQGGYKLYRIPAIVVSNQGTILAFCEARKYTGADSDQIDLLLRRSLDNGKSFESAQRVASQEDWVCGNPAPVVDRETGMIWIVFCKNPRDGNETMVCAGKAPRTVWVTFSADDGKNWAEPVEITASVKHPEWTWYATGPCHGIQLQSGRLVVPANHIVYKNGRRDDPQHSHIIYSDDRGKTWQIGGSAQEGTNESTVFESADGGLQLNSRNKNQGHPKRQHDGNFYRAVSWSENGGGSFSPVVHSAGLLEPACQGSICRFSGVLDDQPNRVLFSNPASTERTHLTIKLSYDEGRTWSIARLLHAGPSGYSDLCVLPDKTICCYYEWGETEGYESLAFARFNLEWLESGDEMEEPESRTRPRAREN